MLMPEAEKPLLEQSLHVKIIAICRHTKTICMNIILSIMGEFKSIIGNKI